MSVGGRELVVCCTSPGVTGERVLSTNKAALSPVESTTIVASEWNDSSCSPSSLVWIDGSFGCEGDASMSIDTPALLRGGVEGAVVAVVAAVAASGVALFAAAAVAAARFAADMRACWAIVSEAVAVDLVPWAGLWSAKVTPRLFGVPLICANTHTSQLVAVSTDASIAMGVEVMCACACQLCSDGGWRYVCVRVYVCACVHVCVCACVRVRVYLSPIHSVVRA